MLPAEVLRNCRSWTEFQSHVATLSKKEKGDGFELLVVFALELHPLYATKLEKVWHHSAVPFEVREHLGIPLKDYGIDIVAQSFEGDYWGVQAKYRGERDDSLTHEELSTFMSLTFGVSARFAFGLVCTTTDRVTHLLEANARVGFCKADFWFSLDEEFFAGLNARLAGHRERPEAKTPRDPDQRDAVAAAVLHFVDAGETRGKFISPCGSGKTLTAWWMAGALNAHRIIVAVPSLFLIGQTLRVWLREAVATGLSVNWLCVCSDESAGKAERDEAVTHAHDLGVPCVTDPARIMTEMRKMNAAREIILTTYQSSPSLAEAAKTIGWQCDLAIFDEAHKTVITRRSRFTHLLFDDHLPIARRIFMTATERRFKGTTDEVVSMDDPKLYGTTFHLLSFKAALESTRPILCDYEILTIGVRESEVRKMIEGRRFITPSRGEFNAMTANAFASLIALRRAVEKFGVAHAVSFHTSIRRAADFRQLSQEFNQAFPEQPAVRSFHIAGTMPSTERDSILREFTARAPSLVTNARCLTEGVDVPRIDCVMFVDPKTSTVDIVQAAGRAMRRADGKAKAYIVLPFVVREGASIDDAAKSANFGFVVAVLRALASQDERIIDELRAIQRGQPTRGGRVLNFDMSAIVPAEVEADKFVEAIELQCWGKLARIAWRPFEEARSFACSLSLRTLDDWQAWRVGRIAGLPKRPEDIPSSPNQIYAGRGWSGWGDFLGTNHRGVLRKGVTFLPFAEARKIVQTVGLSSHREWDLWRQNKLSQKGTRPNSIPAFPASFYSEEWVSWYDWLGKDGRPDWLPFQKARAFARNLQLSGQRAWKKYCTGRVPHLPSLPQGKIPTAPYSVYKEDGWVDWGAWLGTGNVKGRNVALRNFPLAREFARSLGLTKATEWKLFSSGKLPGLPRRPLDIPSEPQKAYAAKGWSGWDDWLGIGSSQADKTLPK